MRVCVCVCVCACVCMCVCVCYLRLSIQSSALSHTHTHVKKFARSKEKSKLTVLSTVASNSVTTTLKNACIACVSLSSSLCPLSFLQKASHSGRFRKSVVLEAGRWPTYVARLIREKWRTSLVNRLEETASCKEGGSE